MTDDKTMSIGSIARASDVPEATLRTWERRYGFPEPLRLPSGHRRYSAATIPKLKLMAAAKDAGMQPSESSQLSVEELRSFLGMGTPTPTVVPRQPRSEDSWLEQIRGMDDAAFDTHLTNELARRGPDRFVAEVIAPLLEAIGNAWQQGSLSVAEEHWASERIRNCLSSQWTAMSGKNSGPSYLCATLPGEQHDLGLHMVATMLAYHGARVLYLGTNTPVDAIVKTVATHPVACVCLSISAVAPPLHTRGLVTALRNQLPTEYGVVVGGGGSFDADGITHIQSWDDLARDVNQRHALRDASRES